VRIYISSQTENPLLSASFDFFVNYRQVDPAQCGKPTTLGTPFLSMAHAAQFVFHVYP